jgi:hypothetical protein
LFIFQKARKERNVLAHQSALLMVDVVGDNRMIMLLGEIENLKAKLEEETNKHNQHSEELQVIQTILFAAKYNAR